MKKRLSSVALCITILLSASLLGIGVQTYAHTNAHVQNNSALLFSQAIYGKS